jgi:SAM-dependent methyltransferase
MPLFSLGELALCNAFIAADEEPARIPLDLIICDRQAGGCGLVQLRHTTPPSLMYTQYWYRSGLSSTMRAHLRGLVHAVEDMVRPQAGDVVLDIGCNDGTLLRSYRTPGLRRVGFEPNRLYREAAAAGTVIVNDFFNASAFHAALGDARAKIVTSIAMFYDLDDPGPFIRDVCGCLAPDGLWIIEMHYVPAMLESNGFDAIVHEHVTYFSLRTLKRLLTRHGLNVVDVEQNPMNGGSFRVWIRPAGAIGPVQSGAAERVRRCEQAEEEGGFDRPEPYRRFFRRVTRMKKQLQTFLRQEVAQGRRVFVYGASTKGNALLQFFGLDSQLIQAAADKNPDKWGLYTPGTLIPIVSPEEAARCKPEYLLVLIWHLIDEVREQWDSYLADGGRLIVPLPRFRVIAGERRRPDHA